MLTKIIICIFLGVIFYCLGSALFYLLSRQKTPDLMAKALTWRIALSVSLFLLLLLGAFMGWIQPHGVS